MSLERVRHELYLPGCSSRLVIIVSSSLSHDSQSFAKCERRIFVHEESKRHWRRICAKKERIRMRDLRTRGAFEVVVEG
jgi:hypothetical protein